MCFLTYLGIYSIYAFKQVLVFLGITGWLVFSWYFLGTCVTFRPTSFSTSFSVNLFLYSEFCGVTFTLLSCIVLSEYQYQNIFYRFFRFFYRIFTSLVMASEGLCLVACFDQPKKVGRHINAGPKSTPNKLPLQLSF